MSHRPRLRIFVFDDDPAITRLLQIVLSGKGHHVLTWPDPTACPVYKNDACHCPQDFPCADVIMTDIMMPRQSGIDLLKVQRARGCKAVPANKALMSASLTAEIRSTAAELGCHFIRKPFRLDEILDWLEECAARIPPQRRLGELGS